MKLSNLLKMLVFLIIVGAVLTGCSFFQEDPIQKDEIGEEVEEDQLEPESGAFLLQIFPNSDYPSISSGPGKIAEIHLRVSQEDTVLLQEVYSNFSEVITLTEIESTTLLLESKAYDSTGVLYQSKTQSMDHVPVDQPVVRDFVLDQVKVTPVSISPQESIITKNALITLSTKTQGASILYTTDGTEPSTSSLMYTAPFTLDSPGDHIVKSLAVAQGMADSIILEKAFSIALEKAETPSISPGSGSYDLQDFPGVTISSSQAGAALYYTINGGTPDSSSAQYTAPIELSQGTHVVRAVSLVDGYLTSEVATKNYTITAPEEIQEVYGASAIGGLRSVTLSWSEPSDYDYQHVALNYGSESAYIPIGTTSFTLDGLQDNRHYSFTLKTVKDGVYSPGIQVSATTSNPAHNYLPYIGPYLSLIHPDLDGLTGTPRVLNPTSHMIINYESKAHHSFKGQVYYRVKGTEKWSLQLEDDYALANHLGKVHHIRLTGLSPNTVYEYQILSPHQSLSKIYSFRTAGTDQNNSRFLILGDHQDEELKQRWDEVAQKILSDHQDEFDFIIHVGDMAKDDTSFNGDRYYWWRVFFEKGRELFASKPLFPTMGNHDTPENPGAPNHSQDYWSNAEDTTSFRKYFYMNPDMSTPDYYSFSYGNAFFLSINSEIPVFYGWYPEKDTENKRSQQGSWIDSTLSNHAQEKSWAFGFTHVPVFNPAGGKDEVSFVRPYSQYFNGRLDWIFSGHVHTYQRSRAIRLGADSLDFRKEYGRGTDQGVGYLVVPPAGHWPRAGLSTQMETDLASYPQDRGNTEGRRAFEVGFSIINLNGEDFSLRTYGMGDVNGRNSAGYGDQGQKRLIDSFEYTRRSTPSPSAFPQVFYRGSSNGWKRTAMNLTAPNTWETVVYVTPGENPQSFKFFTNHDGEKWYGDDNLDNKAQSNQDSNIQFPSGSGTYRIRFNDHTRDYSVLKL